MYSHCSKTILCIHTIEKQFTVRGCGLHTVLCMGVTKINETQTVSSGALSVLVETTDIHDEFEYANDSDEI